MNTKKKHFIFITLGYLILLFGWLYWGNHSIKTTHFNIEDNLIPKSFNGFTIVQVSDLHNTEFGSGNHRLLLKINDKEPDLIAITGDLIDSYHTDIEVAMEFVKNAIKIAPVYFVTGNHEAWLNEYPDFKKQLLQAGVIILDDKMIELSQDNGKIQLVGLADPDLDTEQDWLNGSNRMIDGKLQKIINDNSDYKVLLSHRPELIDVYAATSINLALTGHAHGGQFRIPLIGGVVTPNQGWFPTYTAGLHDMKQTKMIVSRGLGNSIIPVRVNNRPELIVITLKHSNEIQP